MSVTSDKDKFFQTSSSLEKDARRAAKSTNTFGDPIAVNSKILDLIADPTSPDYVFIAESAALARRVQLSSNSKGNHTYRGHTAPVTSLAVGFVAGTLTLYTGSWDKNILCFDAVSRQLVRKFPNGHSDFVKCLLFLPPRSPTDSGLLLSGSSDATIGVWNPTTARKVSSLTGHARGVVSLVLDPHPSESDPTSYTVLSGGSEREIRTWDISSDGSFARESDLPLLTHATSVYKLRFSSDGSDLYTASADNTSQRIAIRNEKRPSEDTLPHPDFVNDVVLAGIDADGEAAWIVTACRDEHVRLWDKASGKLVHVFEGHFEEVTGLCVVGYGAWTVVSVGIDGTVRRWGVRQAEVKAAIEEAKKRAERGVEEEVGKKASGLGVLTEEEERELAELMEDSD